MFEDVFRNPHAGRSRVEKTEEQEQVTGLELVRRHLGLSRAALAKTAGVPAEWVEAFEDFQIPVLSAADHGRLATIAKAIQPELDQMGFYPSIAAVRLGESFTIPIEGLQPEKQDRYFLPLPGGGVQRVEKRRRLGSVLEPAYERAAETVLDGIRLEKSARRRPGLFDNVFGSWPRAAVQKSAAAVAEAEEGDPLFAPGGLAGPPAAEEEDLDVDKGEAAYEVVLAKPEQRFTLLVAAPGRAGSAELEQEAWAFFTGAAERGEAGLAVRATDEEGTKYAGRAVESYIARHPQELEGSWLLGIIWDDATAFAAASAGALDIDFEHGGEA